MIRKHRILKMSTFFMLLFVFVFSCKKDGDETNNTYLVSKNLYVSYSESLVNSVLDAASIYFPGVPDLKQYVETGTSLYRIVYNTTIKGKQTRVSGVVCVPTDAGEYPVLSFQNGTNTLNRNAPSQFPDDKGFQLLHVIASMGYVVVISDYPGFGESNDIPHPYLVKEPTVQSLVDMLYAVKEMDAELPVITIKNEHYVMGYSQGGWATLQLHRALENDYKNDFNLKGSVCGAGPYNIYALLQEMFQASEFPMPYYIGYVLNAYKEYDQFTNPITDILNEPYASRIGSLYTGQLTSGEINSQLTTNMPDLITADFLSGFSTSPKYALVREAMVSNSVAPWKTNVPLLLFHGDADTHVLPSATEDIYNAMIAAGTTEDTIDKIILPGLDHSEGIIPSLVQGFIFINNIRNSNR
ncbi:MAG TPA: lipase family protein [Bacteroidales bacterium]|nr:lipase family protein [Bacteroidales bacterium]